MRREEMNSKVRKQECDQLSAMGEFSTNELEVKEELLEKRMDALTMIASEQFVEGRVANNLEEVIQKGDANDVLLNDSPEP